MTKRSLFIIPFISIYTSLLATTAIPDIWYHPDSLIAMPTEDSIGTNNQPAETICKEAVRLEEFMQVFFADSVFQQKHVRYPLSLYYGVEQDVGVGIPSAQDTIFIEERNYQVLSLDTRSKIIIYEEDSENPYAVISIPDTALEAELYFLRINGSYVLIKINITGDASPFY